MLKNMFNFRGIFQYKELCESQGLSWNKQPQNTKYGTYGANFVIFFFSHFLLWLSSVLKWNNTLATDTELWETE